MRTEEATAMSVGQRAHEARLRAQTYDLLATLFRRELGEGQIDGLHEMLFPAQTGSEKLDRGYRLVADWLSNLWCESAFELAVDYARTFVGHGEDAYGAAFPYESVYTSRKRLMMQEARDEVLAIYRANGVEVGEGWREGEDHVCVELDFMAELARREAARLEAGDVAGAREARLTQAGFLRHHLAWTSQLAADMRSFARTDFYRGWSWLLEGHLEQERVELADATA